MYKINNTYLPQQLFLAKHLVNLNEAVLVRNFTEQIANCSIFAFTSSV